MQSSFYSLQGHLPPMILKVHIFSRCLRMFWARGPHSGNPISAVACGWYLMPAVCFHGRSQSPCFLDAGNELPLTLLLAAFPPWPDLDTHPRAPRPADGSLHTGDAQ